MSEPASARHGVVAVGVWLMSGYGLSLGGVTAQSWAVWLAWALADCCTLHAVNGAAAGEVVRDQLPLLRGRYRLACGGTGANDLIGFTEKAFTASVAELLRGLRRHADVVVFTTLPLLHPRTTELSARKALSRLSTMNRLIRVEAHTAGAVLVDLERALRAPFRMGPDRQHPTSLGQLEVARSAAVALDAAGVRFARHLPDPTVVVVPPSEQAMYNGPAERRQSGWSAVTSWRSGRVQNR